MEIRKVLALRGPNIWANFPVLEAWVDLKELAQGTSTEMPGFNERLMSLAAHADRASLQHRRARRLLRAAATRHLSGPHPRTRHAGTANSGRHTGRLRQGPRDVRRGRLQGRRRIQGRRARPRLPGRPLRVVPGRHPRSRRSTSPAKSRNSNRLGHEVCLGPSTGVDRASRRRPRHSRSAGCIRQPGPVRLRRASSAESAPPKPTAPAPSPNRSPRTRN